jgi:hypothetical protein
VGNSIKKKSQEFAWLVEELAQKSTSNLEIPRYLLLEMQVLVGLRYLGFNKIVSDADADEESVA